MFHLIDFCIYLSNSDPFTFVFNHTVYNYRYIITINKHIFKLFIPLNTYQLKLPTTVYDNRVYCAHLTGYLSTELILPEASQFI